ncbi:hypothetical protein [Nonomuraea jabiensis]|uniref:hypothetical protein n=1 Tax=Nonomuraea jabiensis TaxID=882448 RepID=UPI0036BA6704
MVVDRGEGLLGHAMAEVVRPPGQHPVQARQERAQTLVEGVPVGPLRDPVLDRLDGFPGRSGVDNELVRAAFPLAVDVLAEKVEPIVNVDQCQRLGVIQSMGRVGCALDNAAAEAFYSTLKVEYVHRHRFRTRAEARLKIATSITCLTTTPPGGAAPTTDCRPSHSNVTSSRRGQPHRSC